MCGRVETERPRRRGEGQWYPIWLGDVRSGKAPTLKHIPPVSTIGGGRWPEFIKIGWIKKNFEWMSEKSESSCVIYSTVKRKKVFFETAISKYVEV